MPLSTRDCTAATATCIPRLLCSSKVERRAPPRDPHERCFFVRLLNPQNPRLLDFLLQKKTRFIFRRRLGRQNTLRLSRKTHDLLLGIKIHKTYDYSKPYNSRIISVFFRPFINVCDPKTTIIILLVSENPLFIFRRRSVRQNPLRVSEKNPTIFYPTSKYWVRQKFVDEFLKVL